MVNAVLLPVRGVVVVRSEEHYRCIIRCVV